LVGVLVATIVEFNKVEPSALTYNIWANNTDNKVCSVRVNTSMIRQFLALGVHGPAVDNGVRFVRSLALQAPVPPPAADVIKEAEAVSKE
jgi:hypothetical protein